MRTIQLMFAGFLLLGAFYIVAKRFVDAAPITGIWMLGLFLLTWLIMCAVNMYLGVARAGYTVLEELPIFVLLFGVPSIAALLLKWK